MDDRLGAYRLLIADVYELAWASRRTSERMASELGHTVARWHVMSVVSEGPRTVPAIARRLGQARQGVQRVVHELDGRDLVERRDNPDHARSPLIALTPDGREQLQRLFRVSAASRARLLEAAEVDVGDLDGARRVIRALLDGLGEAEHR